MWRPPPLGRIPSSQMVELVKQSKLLYGHPVWLITKTIAVRTGEDSWANYGTVARLTEARAAQTPDQDVIELGKEVRLISHAVDAELVQDLDELRRQLSRWRQITQVKSGFQFREDVQVRREQSRNDWSDASPCWVFEPEEDTSDRLSESPPDGPFLNPKEEIFADEIPTLAKRWLRCPALSEQRQVRNQYWLVVSDPRPYLDELEAVDDKLTIRVTETGDEPLYCGAAVTSLQGEEYELWTPVEHSSAEAEIEFKGSVKELSLYLMLEDGEWLDRYHESERFQSWDQSLFNQPREQVDTKYADLVSALDEGESESVEFKEWISAAKRNKKSRELLVSAVAFSNKSGGYIFIGVDDHGEPDNLIPQLEKAYGKESSGDLEAMENEYVRDLRRMLKEGVAPEIQPEFDWIEKAKLPVLRITIPAGEPSVRYVLSETRIAYIRMGATDRKLGDTRWTDLRIRRPSFPLEEGQGGPGIM